MRDNSTLIHLEYLSERPFDEVVPAFEGATGAITNDEFRRAIVDSAGNADEFIKRMHAFEGSSGFMRFLDIDHSAWMKPLGVPGRAKLYILGNPLIAATMIRFSLGAALNVPVRALIVEDPATRRATLAYDLPSSLMARLRNNDVDAAASKLDEKLAALAELATGAKA